MAKINKQLAGMQDLLTKRGITQQLRSGKQVEVNGIDVPFAVDTTEEMQALDITRFTHSRVYTGTTTYVDYIYDATRFDGVPSNTGPGTWIVASGSGGQGGVGVIEEQQTLAAGQQVVTFNTIDCNIAAFYICTAENADRGRLCKPDDYTVLSSGQIELVETYPVGTKLIALVNEQLNTSEFLNKNTIGLYTDYTVNQLADIADSGISLEQGQIWNVLEREVGSGGQGYYRITTDTPNGYDVIALSPTLSATLIVFDKTIDLTSLGLISDTDNAAGFIALNALITAGKVTKVLFSSVYKTSAAYTMPVVNFNLTYLGLHGGIKPTISGFEFTHTSGADGFVIPTRTPSWHIENLYIKGNGTGGDGVKMSGSPTANHTANSIYVKDWGNDGFYINNVFIARFMNLMAEDCGRDGINLDFANEVQLYGASVERAGRWGINNNDGYINTIVANVSDCGTGATGGGVAIQKGGSNTVNLYYESINVGRSRKAFFIGNKAIDTQMTARIAKTDTWIDDGVNSNIKATGQGVFNADPRNLLLNIANPSFEQSALGTSGWLSNEGNVTLSRENDGDSGNFSLQAAIVGSSGNANFFASGAGYSYNIAQDQTIFVEFSIKTSRPLSINGERGEYAIFELIGLSDAEPGFFNIIPETSNQWRRVSMAFSANVAATNVRPRFKVVGLTGDVDVQVTDLVWTTNLAPVKKTTRPDSTATDVASVVADLNLLLENLRGQGLIART